MKKQASFLIVFFLLLVGCDELKQALGQVVVSVNNRTSLNGVEIRANGERKFTLNQNEKKSFSVSGLTTNSIRVIASHSQLNSDLVFTVIASGNDGGRADLLLSTELVAGSERIRLTCPGCESLFGMSETRNPLK